MEVVLIDKRSLHALVVIHSVACEHKRLSLKINMLTLLSSLLRGKGSTEQVGWQQYHSQILYLNIHKIEPI